MSGLAGMLAGHRPPGAYRWHSGLDADDVRHAVEHAGWRFAHHEGFADETREDLLTGLGTALDFPSHYGRNLDALADCLRDVVPGDRVGTVLLWDGWGSLARADERGFARVLAVLATRAGAVHRAPFAVLLRGPGPEHVDAPELA
jgi:RNAse (barnase) inhibitor barstar